MMGDRVHGVFGFGALAFLVFTMFDSYRTAENQARRLMESSKLPNRRLNRTEPLSPGDFPDNSRHPVPASEFHPYNFLHNLWPLVFILLGGYLSSAEGPQGFRFRSGYLSYRF
jgi:hypothetical protein